MLAAARIQMSVTQLLIAFHIQYIPCTGHPRLLKVRQLINKSAMGPIRLTTANGVKKYLDPMPLKPGSISSDSPLLTNR